MTPKEIVSYLDEYIIGQKDAKKIVAIALRNRYRRLQLPKEIQDEVMPKNILMIGSTGVGKTEIARRMAKIMGLPFVKVEASKYTEVGFVGRDVESMVRDLVVASINLVKEEHKSKSTQDMEKYVLDKIVEKLIPPLPKGASEQKIEEYEKAASKMRQKVLNGEMDHLKIEVEVPKKTFEIEDGNMPAEFAKVQETIAKVFIASPKDSPKKEVTIKEAKELLKVEASEALLDLDAIKHEGLKRAESSGIIFIDEIDKVAVSGNGSQRQDPSKEGVQRDLLPIVEGSVVNTKYGSIKTDHILFIAAGAFSLSKPSDLIAELQGRFPLRVELDSLDEEALYKILTQTKNSILRQYEALLGVEEVRLSFSDEAIRALAHYSQVANEKTEDIGARRLHTVVEQVIEEISFEAENYKGQDVEITEVLVKEKLESLVADSDIARYIL
ncbi:HslU--HslV peptidase ATPase subunit [Helicobacter winghamensis]|uniref:HslU--HslV peptidase ATPase subunit n=1 Tax=Helicobacter winghamensis TaxID=157268 RepID=A0A2N3PK39_9HELI|nr:HslU--HslV peptidase ATPase subunit [Helicobacter winghamensis]PKT77344.1 HslU--HslV peptidase ATPase subunit [Helicobacter winghamensis]PKT81510.1 HslU--HslV peptidase ATPase subunit [Helicobacter winghamensis]PKT81687.1 HslU--HslV peptidase ATPase subunit [Helicobacter winghamensis]